VEISDKEEPGIGCFPVLAHGLNPSRANNGKGMGPPLHPHMVRDLGKAGRKHRESSASHPTGR